MDKYSNNNPFGKAFLTGLFLGILATLVCFAYDIYFRMRLITDLLTLLMSQALFLLSTQFL